MMELEEEEELDVFGKWKITDVKSLDNLLSLCCPCKNPSSHTTQVVDTENKLSNYWNKFNTRNQRKTRSEIMSCMKSSSDVGSPNTDNADDDMSEICQSTDSVDAGEQVEEKIDEKINEAESTELLMENLKHHNKMLEVNELMKNIKEKPFFENIITKIMEKERNDDMRIKLCRALLECNVNCQVIFRCIFQPWCDEDVVHLSVFINCIIASMDKCGVDSIEHIVIPCLFHRQSPFLHDQLALKDIMTIPPHNYMPLLLRKFIDKINNEMLTLTLTLLPAFHIMVENSTNLDDNLLKDVVTACSRSVYVLRKNSTFTNILLILIPRCSDCIEALNGIKSLANYLEGFRKIKILTMLKD